MISSSPINSDNHAPSAQHTLSGKVGVLAAAAIIAASLSVALPMQVTALPTPGGHGVSVHNGTGHLNVTTLAFVTKGQKG